MARNEIGFERRKRDDRGVLEIVPHVDGVPLTELVDRFEIAAGMQPAVVPPMRWARRRPARP